jgi:ADP-heptose:LPS heptosyltransferase/lauroyl/myristoyl acyltransferase
MAFTSQNQTPNRGAPPPLQKSVCVGPPRPAIKEPRVLLSLLKILGWLTARSPERVLQALASALGALIYFGLPRRRQLILSNLHHAFPERSAAWRRGIARESCRRLVETALLSLATPYLSAARFRTIVSASPEALAAFARHDLDPAPTLICSPHLAYWEAQTAIGITIPGRLPEFGTIFRPLDHPAVDAFVKSSRERFGLRLLSRKEGFAEALKILRRRGFVGILFDQNAGMGGALTTLFGRVCSTTELPGLMAEKFNARVYGIFPRRLGFWRVEIGAELLAHDGTGPGVTLGLNRWLEERLAADDNLCASWLWAHSRWRNQDMPTRRLRLEAKRDLLAADLAARGLASPRRRTRIWVRLPNWLGDVVMALPLLRAIRASRPDAEITLFAKGPFLPLLASWGVADQLHALPPRGFGYFRHFWRLRSAYPDVWLLFTNSLRGDLEARLTGCRQRFGLVRPGKRRPLLSHAYRVAPDFVEREHHQIELWERFLRHFGLAGEIDRTPLAPAPAVDPRRAPVGLICGSENMPAKRWPVAHWRTLIEYLPQETFVLFGTANDQPIAAAVAAGFPAERVRNAAGRTDLPAFTRELAACRGLVTNDTGGMHLANAQGVPLIVLFGPTNPIRTGPVFSGRVTLLQPPGSAPTGGGDLSNLAPETVVAAVRALSAPQRGAG